MESEKAWCRKTKTWRKLHLAVDMDNYEAISAEVSLVNIGVSKVLPTLLSPYAEASQ